MEPSKRDWKLYREEVSGWQEHYMGRLIKGYAAYLDNNEPASTKLWTTEKRVRQDKKTPRVCTELSRRDMIFDLVHSLQGEVIVFDDLDKFLEELRKNVKFLKERFG